MAEDAVSKNKIVVVGGSAGSLDIVLQIVHVLQSVDASIIVIMHRKNDGESILPDLIAARTNLVVKEVEDKDPILPATVYVAPADYHLLIEDLTTFSLDYSEKVHYCRPSIDVTFESVAEFFGSSAIGVLLSGANVDGAAGLYKIKKAGGFTIVQDPATAIAEYMPQQAINLFKPDAIINGDLLPAFVKTILSQVS